MGIFGRGRPSSQDPPSEPGEYRIRDRDGNIKYIGTTGDLSRREYEHRHSGKYDPQAGEKFEWQKCNPDVPSSQRYEHETEKIHRHDPPGNIRKRP